MTRISFYVRTAALSAALLLLALAPSSADSASLNDIARYLAGMKPSANSPLAPLTREADWTFHARTLDQAWDRIEKRQLSRIRAWSKKHLPEHRDFMLYMFSGPDFLYADAFYPNASTYVLSALEPVVALPDMTKLSRGGRALSLRELRVSMQEVLSYSFFRTIDMKTDLHTGNMRGTLPLLFVFLARSGNAIDDVAFIRLNKDGTVTPVGDGGRGTQNGVKITFTGDKGRKRTLYYFQTDLSNGGLPNSGFMTFCDTFGPSDSLVKSASYLLHGSHFSTARDYLLKKSAVIIQDDSGLPLRYFDTKKWELNPFGRYTGPIELFANKYQHDMARLFSRNRAKKIDFGIGYKWRTYETNLLLAINRQTPAPKREAQAAPEPVPATRAGAESKPDVKTQAEPSKEASSGAEANITPASESRSEASSETEKKPDSEKNN